MIGGRIERKEKGKEKRKEKEKAQPPGKGPAQKRKCTTNKFSTYMMRSEGHESHVAETRAEFVKAENVFPPMQKLMPHSRGQVPQEQVPLLRMLQIRRQIVHFVVDGDDLAEDGEGHGQESVGY